MEDPSAIHKVKKPTTLRSRCLRFVNPALRTLESYPSFGYTLVISRPTGAGSFADPRSPA